MSRSGVDRAEHWPIEAEYPLIAGERSQCVGTSTDIEVAPPVRTGSARTRESTVNGGLRWCSLSQWHPITPRNLVADTEDTEGKSWIKRLASELP